jgi:hypothetical protein
VISEADDVASTMRAIAEWDDVMDLRPEQGLEYAKKMLPAAKVSHEHMGPPP